MTDNTDGADCARNCWIMGAVGGVICALLLLALAGWSFLSSVFAGIVIAIILGYLLIQFRCSSSGNASASGPAATSVSAASAASTDTTTSAAPAASSAAATAHAAPAKAVDLVDDAPETSPADEAAPVQSCGKAKGCCQTQGSNRIRRQAQTRSCCGGWQT